MANPWEMSYDAPGPWTLDYEQPEEGSLYTAEEGARLQAEAEKAAGDVPEIVPDTLGDIGSAAWKLANTALGHDLNPKYDTAAANDVLAEIAKMGAEGVPISKARAELDRRLAEQPYREPTTGEQVFSGAQNVINENLATPLALALPVINRVLPAPVAKAAGLAFGAQAASQVPEAARQAGEASVTGDAFERTKAFGNLAATLGIPPLVAMDLVSRGKPTTEGEPNASSVEAPAKIYGDVRPQPIEGEGKVPVEESGKGVQPPAEAAKEQVPELQRDLKTEYDKAIAEGRTEDARVIGDQIKEETITRRIEEGIAPENVKVTINNDPSIPDWGFVQVDEVTPAKENVFSSNPEDMNRRGFEMPSTKELIQLPRGQYTLPEVQKMLDARNTLPLSEFKGEVPEDHIPIKVQRPDGSTYEAFLAGVPGSKMAGTKIAKVKADTGGLSHGVLGKGDKIIEGPKTAEEYVAARVPTVEALPAYEKGVAATGTQSLFIDPFFYQAGIRPLGRAARAAFNSPVAQKLRTQMEDIWNALAIKSAPKLTRSKRELGEAGVRYASSHAVGRTKGQIFADKVLADSGIDPVKFGTALAEDNLRSIRENASTEDAARVQTLIGDETSPFRTEQEYQDFLNDPLTQAAIERHKQLWAEQKDPIFRQANDLDPDLPLETRGAQTGARINLKALQPEEAGVAPIGRRAPGFRQLATLKRRDPFGRKATGAGQAYEGHYHEIMANGFERELPVAAQHEFLKQLIDNGDAVVSDKMREPELQLKGEGTDKGYLLTLKPWTGKFLHVRQGLRPEFESISGLVPSSRLPVITAFNDFMTRQSVAGLAEGTTHASNLMTQIFTMPGPTANPMLNALVKSLGRVDLLYSIPRVLIKGFSNQRERMLELAEIGAAKEPYPGAIAKKILNPIDQGVRLVSDDVYKGLAEKGIVENNETARREFVNQVGQYNKALQPMLTRKLRESGVQPFITAGQTFNAQGLRRLALSPGVKATSNARALALKADVAAGWLGAIVLVTALNKIVSGSATGPAGTPLGAVGWVGDDKKVHNFNLMRLLGYERGLRVTGIGPAIQAKRLGLSTQQAGKAAAESVASTGLGMLAGPGPRAAVIASTGVRPTQPWIKEVDTVPPTDSLNPLKTQMAANIQKAIEEANPVLSSAATMRDELKRGKPVAEAAKEAVYKQATRYTPKAGMSEQTVKALPKIVDTRQLREYVDGVTKEARKLPVNQRYNYIRRRFNEDELGKKYRDPAWAEVEKRGVLRYR